MARPRIPTSFQWLNWAAGLIEMDPAQFSRRCDLIALEGSLDRLRSVPLHGEERTDTARILATLLMWFTARPPFPRLRRRLAIETAELIAELSGYELVLMPRHRALLSDGLNPHTNKPPRSVAELTAVLSPRLREMSGPEAVGARESIANRLGDPAHERPRIVISRPATLLEDNESAMLDEIVLDVREKCEIDLRLFIARRGGRVHFQHSALGPLCIDAPACDHGFEDDQHSNCQRNIPLLLQANALVILGYAGGSHTTGYEHAMVPSAAPVLYVAWNDDPLPTAIAGGMSPRRVIVQRVRHSEDVGEVVLEFLEDNWDAIVRAWHVCELRKLRYGPLAARIKARLAELDEPQLTRLLERWGLRLDVLTWMLTADGLAATSSETIEVICGALGLEGGVVAGGRERFHLRKVQLEALQQFAVEYAVPLQETEFLEKAAEHQIELGVLRLSLTSVRGWLEFRRQLKEQGGPLP